MAETYSQQRLSILRGMQSHSPAEREAAYERAQTFIDNPSAPEAFKYELREGIKESQFKYAGGYAERDIAEREETLRRQYAQRQAKKEAQTRTTQQVASRTLTERVLPSKKISPTPVTSQRDYLQEAMIARGVIPEHDILREEAKKAEQRVAAQRQSRFEPRQTAPTPQPQTTPTSAPSAREAILTGDIATLSQPLKEVAAAASPFEPEKLMQGKVETKPEIISDIKTFAGYSGKGAEFLYSMGPLGQAERIFNLDAGLKPAVKFGGEWAGASAGVFFEYGPFGWGERSARYIAEETVPEDFEYKLSEGLWSLIEPTFKVKALTAPTLKAKERWWQSKAALEKTYENYGITLYKEEVVGLAGLAGGVLSLWGAERAAGKALAPIKGKVAAEKAARTLTPTERTAFEYWGEMEKAYGGVKAPIKNIAWGEIKAMPPELRKYTQRFVSTHKEDVIVGGSVAQRTQMTEGRLPKDVDFYFTTPEVAEKYYKGASKLKGVGSRVSMLKKGTAYDPRFEITYKGTKVAEFHSQERLFANVGEVRGFFYPSESYIRQTPSGVSVLGIEAQVKRKLYFGYFEPHRQAKDIKDVEAILKSQMKVAGVSPSPKVFPRRPNIFSTTTNKKEFGMLLGEEGGELFPSPKSSDAFFNAKVKDILSFEPYKYIEAKPSPSFYVGVGLGYKAGVSSLYPTGETFKMPVYKVPPISEIGKYVPYKSPTYPAAKPEKVISAYKVKEPRAPSYPALPKLTTTTYAPSTPAEPSYIPKIVQKTTPYFPKIVGRPRRIYEPRKPREYREIIRPPSYDTLQPDFPPPAKGKPLWPSFPSLKRKKAEPIEKLFFVYGKRFGEWFKLSERAFPKFAAMGLGAKFASETAGRSFKVVFAGKGRTKGDVGLENFWKKVKYQFRAPVRGRRVIPNTQTFIEKVGHTIDTAGEKQEITIKGLNMLKMFPNLRKKKRRRKK